ncbi:MAG: hypothetical protein KatS3mg012_1762 [Gaiellaceae bacterium]|nr:MAG: hypothetical protein KatS3mg012_1762 [Gaiellaceae bacterium]
MGFRASRAAKGEIWEMGTVGKLRRLLLAATLAIGAAVLVGVPLGASATNDIGNFELDGNAAGAGRDDWDARNTIGAPLFFTGFIEDGTGASDTGYGTGSNKDTDQISDWSWKTGQVTPAKDNIAHAYAAVYEEKGDLVLYFGQNRQVEQQGNANVGVWFLQNPVGLGANGKFTGSHAEGDVLVQAELTNGGSIAGIRIGKWTGGSLQFLANSAAECADGKLGTKDACGIANTVTISTSWAGNIPSPYFFEGGLNLSALFPNGAPCFSTVLMNTRTSQSTTAELKDFAFGTFDTCGSITVRKQATPADGTKFDYTASNLSPAAFQLAAGESRTFDKLGPGVYSVTEVEPTGGWEFDSLSCTGGANVSVSGRTATITLGFLEDVTCTYVNKPKPGKLIVIKNVVNDDGGTKVAGDFAIEVSGNNPSPASFAGQGAPGQEVTIGPGSYSVTETEDPGYAVTYSSDCSGTMPAGGTKTCTITNDDKPAKLIVIKNVVNDNGGTKVAGDFPIQVSGNNPSPATFAGQGAPGQEVAIGPGSYSVTETEDPSYAASYSADCSGSIALGQTKTCTITNDDKAPKLTLVKQVVNDNGGTASASDWTLTASPNGFSGQGPSVSSGASFQAGTYNLSESGPAGYDAGEWVCEGGSQDGASITLGLGESATCTITNDDRPATLIVKKVVVNDNGGTKVASDFSFQVNGGAAQAFEADGENELAVSAGTYSVTEVAVDGYETSYDNCSNLVIPNGGSATCTITNDDRPATLIVKKVVVNDNGGTKVASDFSFQVNGGAAQAFEADGENELAVSAGTYSVTEVAVDGYETSYDNCSNLVIPNGGSATCTITNDDQAAHLTLVKVVKNDNGGTATAEEWTLSADGPTPLSGAGGAEGDVSAGTYTLSESGPAGYDAGEWVCEGGSQDGASITLGLGESATCTITNDDQAAHLTLVKVVKNDNGGTATAEEWTLSADGPTPLSGAGGAEGDVSAGTYTLSESGPAGYDAGEWVCEGGSQDGASITLGLGESATCTITNDDQAAHLTLVKVVKNDNGGTATAEEWTLSADGPTPLSGAGGAEGDVSAGTYTLSESGPAGYDAGEWVCEGGSQDGASITLGLGESATCTITNDDIVRGVGAIRVSKSANQSSVKEPGGPVTYTVTITNTSNVLVTIENVVDDRFGDLDDSGGNGCFDVPINLAAGASTFCQFTGNVTGAAGTSHVNVVTATGTDEFGNRVSDSDDARVDITPLLIDLVVDKTASSPTPLNGTVNYTMTVTNKGPDTATNVQLADPAPAGITLLTATASQGTCTVSAALITCNLGTIAPGQTVTVNATGRATAVGTHVNTVTVSGQGGRETNPADNVDSAQTVVPRPIQPPTPEKPKPEPAICLTLTVTPKTITADGKPDKVRVLVTAAKKRQPGVKVVVKGAGVSKTGRTAKNGVAVLTINPKKAGLLTVTVQERNRKACGPARVGVVGVFLPPLTG